MTGPASNAAASLLSSEYLSSVGRGAQTQVLDAIQSEKFRRGVGRTLLTGLGLGAAARGFNGLFNVTRRNVAGPASATGPRILPVPVLEDEEKSAGLGETIGDFFAGRMANTAAGMPTYYPAALLTGVAGAVGGWKATDALLDQRRQSDLKSELATAREDYEKALLKQGSAEASELGRDLDSLFDRYVELQGTQKSAGALDSAKDLAGRVATPVLGALAGVGALGAENAGKVTGVALTVPAVIAAASGLASYGMTRGQQQEKLLQKAVQRRRARQLAAGPLYAFPSKADGSPYVE
jgi:hypothetical protein